MATATAVARHPRGLAMALLAAALLAAFPHAGARADAPATLTLRLSSPVVTFGDSLGAGGTITRGGVPVAGAVVRLELDRYPYDGFVAIASARSAADGGFAFAGVHPSRNARVRVVADGAAPSASRQVTVTPAVRLGSRVLGRGRTVLTATAVHTKAYGSPAVDAYWYVAPRGSFHFRLVAITKTHETRAGVTTMSATIDPPARRFSFVVCFVPGWARAMGPPSARLRCRDHDFVAVRPRETT